MGRKKYTIASFFSGVGGIEYGFEQEKRFKTVWANELDEKAAKTYQMNFKHQLIVSDIINVPLEDIPVTDILVGGFPCQAFSIAGYQKGFEDERGALFFDLLKVIVSKKPRVVFLENVKNLESHDNGNTYRIIKQALESNGYYVHKQLLNSKDYGNIPQNRERIYIIAFKEKNDYANFTALSTIPLTKEIKDVLDSEVPERYFYRENGSSIYEELKEKINKENVAYQWRRKYVRENKSGVFPTLTANMGMGGHNVPIVLQNDSIRKLTPRECFRVQGYDDNFILPTDLADSNLYKQAGNSVVVPVITRLANSIYKALQQTDKETKKIWEYNCRI